MAYKKISLNLKMEHKRYTKALFEHILIQDVTEDIMLLYVVMKSFFF